MKYKFSAILTAIVLTHSMLHAAEIKFAAKKGEVVAHSEREVVLSVAKKHLEGKGEGAFLAELKSVEEPFGLVSTTGKDSTTKAVATEESKPAPEIVYDDASVLKVIADNFSKQIRGTLARGNNSYIQLQGGGLLKEGASFAGYISEAKDKPYNVKLIEVTSDEFTLSLGEASLTKTYSDNSDGVKRTQPLTP